MKKLVSLFVALALVLGCSLPALAAEAPAAESGQMPTEMLEIGSSYAQFDSDDAASPQSYKQQALPSCVVVGGTYLMRDGKATGESVRGASYIHSTKTLTLDGFTGSNIYARGINLKLVLNGKNTIKGYTEQVQSGSKITWGIGVTDGKLTISGAGTLNVKAVNSGSVESIAIVAYKGVDVQGGNLELTAKGKRMGSGLYAPQGTVNIRPEAGFSIKISAQSSQNIQSAVVGKVIKIKSGGNIVQKSGASSSKATVGKIKMETTRFSTGAVKIIYSKFISVQNFRDDQLVAVTGVKLNQTKKTVKKGKEYTLKATFSPKNATNTAVTWKSSKPKVAKVNSSGVVTAKKKGKATITVTTKDGKFKASCVITVK